MFSTDTAIQMVVFIVEFRSRRQRKKKRNMKFEISRNQHWKTHIRGGRRFEGVGLFGKCWKKWDHTKVNVSLMLSFLLPPELPVNSSKLCCQIRVILCEKHIFFFGWFCVFFPPSILTCLLRVPSNRWVHFCLCDKTLLLPSVIV